MLTIHGLCFEMSAKSENIPNLETLLLKHLEEDEILVKYECSPLTAPGENFGSVISSLKITVKNQKSQKERILDTVAKSLVPDEKFQKIFNSKTAFKNEIGFYTVIVPILENFLNQYDFQGTIDFLPKYIGSRQALNQQNVENDSTILILENLKATGYTTGNRLIGFDYDTTLIVLKTLAKFHVIPLALKMKDPKTFESKIKPYLSDFVYDQFFSNVTLGQIAKYLNENPTYVSAATRTVSIKSNKIVHEDWATIMHNDLWVTNIMLKYDENKKLKNIKLIDFQLCEYKSCLRDLLMFLFTSVQDVVLSQSLDTLIDIYYQEFIDNLKKFKVDVSKYSRKNFDEQLKFDARESEYFHLLMAINPIFYEGDPNTIKNFDDIEKFKKSREIIGKRHREKLMFITKEFATRDWLAK